MVGLGEGVERTEMVAALKNTQLENGMVWRPVLLERLRLADKALAFLAAHCQEGPGGGFGHL